MIITFVTPRVLLLSGKIPPSGAKKAYSEKNDIAAIHALLGLARSDLKGSLTPILKRLTQVDFTKLG